MKPSWGIVALAVLVLSPSPANARGPRTGTVMTPFGPVYNTGSPEWKMAGGNPLIYEQIMEQKAMQQQQMLLMKQEQELLKMRKKAGTLNGPGGTNTATFTQPAPLRRRKKKIRTYDPTHPVTSPAHTTDAKTPAGTPPGSSRTVAPKVEATKTPLKP